MSSSSDEDTPTSHLLRGQPYEFDEESLSVGTPRLLKRSATTGETARSNSFSTRRTESICEESMSRASLANDKVDVYEYLLRMMVEDCGFCYGEAWEPCTFDPSLISHTGVTVVSSKETGEGEEAFKDLGKYATDHNMRLAVGEGIPGRAWQLGRREWNVLPFLIANPENPINARQKVASRLFHTSLAIPCFGARSARPLVAPSDAPAARASTQNLQASPTQHVRRIWRDSRAFTFSLGMGPLASPDLICVLVFFTKLEPRICAGRPAIHNAEVDLYLDHYERVLPHFIQVRKANAVLKLQRRLVATRGMRRFSMIARMGLRPSQQGESPPPSFFRSYLSKLRGAHSQPCEAMAWKEVMWTWIQCFLAVAILSFMHDCFPHRTVFLGSYGSLAILLYAAPNSPFAQPRNVLAAHAIGVFVAVAFALVLATHPFGHWRLPQWFANAGCVASACGVMALLGVIHPPAGSLTLMIVEGARPTLTLESIGFHILPILLGLSVLLLIAIFVNNCSKKRRYPLFW